VIEVFELNAVIRVDALAVGISQRVRAPIVVRNDRKRAVGTPQDLPSHAGSLVELPVRLPSVDDPGLDLQLVARIDLNPNAIEVPGSVGRNVGRLICPVVKLVEAEESDVGEENSAVDVDPVQLVDVVAPIGLTEVAIGVVQVVLAPAGAGVVAGL